MSLFSNTVVQGSALSHGLLVLPSVRNSGPSQMRRSIAEFDIAAAVHYIWLSV